MTSLASSQNAEGDPWPLRPGYLIVGSGKLAKHLSHYFQQLEVDHLMWSRQHSSKANLNELIPLVGRVLLAIRDDAIAEFFEALNLNSDQVAVHFSGALYDERIVGVHPLASFSNQFFKPEFYQSIHMAVDQPYKFEQIFPELPNPSFSISSETKGLYHSLLVLKASSEFLLGNEMMARFAEFNWPQQGLTTFFKSLELNLFGGKGNEATGPLVRGDDVTIDRNLEALSGTELEALYRQLNQIYKRRRQ